MAISKNDVVLIGKYERDLLRARKRVEESVALVQSLEAILKQLRAQEVK